MKKLLLVSNRSLSVHSIFLTVQGEGIHAGKRAVFIRMSGCNVWNGVDGDRARDSKNSICSVICDTDFKGVREDMGGGRFTQEQLVDVALATWGSMDGERFVVFTGGEPSLQIDAHVVALFRARGFYTAMETNGTNPPSNLHWTTLSPKFPMPYKDMTYDEVKLLSCFLKDGSYRSMAQMIHATHYWVQPVDYGVDSEATARSKRDAAEFVLNNRGWRLGSQMHRSWGLA